MQRIRSVDLMRGLVMVIMALDHVRDFWAPSAYAMQPVIDPTIPTEWYLTRWITHLCAPAFVFLAGTSSRLWEITNGASKRELSIFLFTRGLWLVFIEFAVVNWSWQFDYSFSFGQVIWAIGMSMITLAVLVHLPRMVILGFGLLLVFGHDLFNAGGLIGPLVEWQGPASTLPQWLWAFMHEGRFGCIFGEMGANGCVSGQPYFAAYPLIPWLGVIALGYLFADVLREDEGLKRARNLGLAMIAAFVVIRATNFYGDPSPWSVQESGVVDTVKSFFNGSKYPPSLLYLLVTLGITLSLMPALERMAGSANAVISRISGWITVYGKVPFFYYVLHVPLIHATSRLYFGWDNGSWAIHGPAGWPEGYAPSLLLAYLAWFLIVWALYIPCRWYAGLKRRHKDWRVLSYL
jgi:uncharacterized membrane protein